MSVHVIVGSVVAADEEAALVAVLLVPVVIGFAIAIGFGFWGKSILENKGRSGASGFCLGFFLGFIGLIICALLQAEPSRRPNPHGFASPTFAPAAAASSGQWSADPYGRHELRYFDGTVWTAHVSSGGHSGTDPIPATPTPQLRSENAIPSAAATEWWNR